MIDESNRISETIRNYLIEFGVEPAKAHEASQRYSSIEAATTWVFGEGEDWKPGQERQESTHVSLKPTRVGVTARPSSPALVRHTSQEPAPQFASNNPFNQYAFPAPPTAPPGIASTGHEDEELRRAIELSTQQEEEDRGRRQERERSVRASAPPPSPGRIDDEEQIGSLFGPSNKDDPKGALAMVPASETPNTNNKEEEDFQRAIQESMMTASFHSAGGESSETLPPPTERDPAAPLVYVTRKDSAWAANLMQALAAVPQLREGFLVLDRLETDLPTFADLQNVFALQSRSEYSYQPIDKEIDGINSRCDIQPSAVRLPPISPFIDHWIQHVLGILRNVVMSRLAIIQGNMAEVVDGKPLLRDVLTSPEQVMATRLFTQPDTPQTHVTIDRSYSTPPDIHGNLAAIIWNSMVPGEAIKSMADVVFVTLKRTPGVNVHKWNFDEEVVLDRYMLDNLEWATQVRAQEHLVKLDIRRLQEQIDTLSTFRGHSLPDALQTLVKQLGAESDVDVEKRAALKQKLEAVSETISAKVAALQEQVKEKEASIQGGFFMTDDPNKNLHRYHLRAILWHDGFTTPGKHLFAYVHHDNGWWKVEDTDASKVDWETIQADTTGQYTDGGPYMLVYSRDGPRPDGHSRNDHLMSPTCSASSSVSEEPMEEVDFPSVAGVEVASVGQRNDLLMDEEDEEEETVGWKPPPPPQRQEVDLLMQEEEVRPSAPEGGKSDWELVGVESQPATAGPKQPELPTGPKPELPTGHGPELPARKATGGSPP